MLSNTTDTYAYHVNDNIVYCFRKGLEEAFYDKERLGSSIGMMLLSDFVLDLNKESVLKNRLGGDTLNAYRLVTVVLLLNDPSAPVARPLVSV